MIISLFSIALYFISIILLFNLTPAVVCRDLIDLITPKETIADKAKKLRAGKKNKSLYRKLMSMKTAMEAGGKKNEFTVCITLSVLLFLAGIAIALVIDNIFLIPFFSIALGLSPFFYASFELRSYEKHINEELETALSVITTSYIRNEDIVTAVRENLGYIRPPLRESFSAFVGEATAVSSSVRMALINLRDRTDNAVFHEWCETLIRCQNDRTLKDTLLPLVTRLSDARRVGNEMKAVMSQARNEYLTMVLLVVGNIPLLYVLNKDWFNSLLFTTPGKLVLGICGVVILVTAGFMVKFTKPVEYKA